MKYKGTNKIYFGIGVMEAHDRLNAIEVFFYWFKLKQRPPQGECLESGRDYIGFDWRKKVQTVFNLNIEL